MHDDVSSSFTLIRSIPIGPQQIRTTISKKPEQSLNKVAENISSKVIRVFMTLSRWSRPGHHK